LPFFSSCPFFFFFFFSLSLSFFSFMFHSRHLRQFFRLFLWYSDVFCSRRFSCFVSSVSHDVPRWVQSLCTVIILKLMFGFQIWFKSSRKAVSSSRHLSHGCARLPFTCEINMYVIKRLFKLVNGTDSMSILFCYAVSAPNRPVRSACNDERCTSSMDSTGRTRSLMNRPHYQVNRKGTQAFRHAVFVCSFKFDERIQKYKNISTTQWHSYPHPAPSPPAH
jgi:hypothetical protein